MGRPTALLAALALASWACGGSATEPTTTAASASVAPTTVATTSTAPPPTSATATTAPPTTTTTAAPTTTTTTAPTPLQWPSDVGTSRFGVLGQSFEVAGGWIRPHPGVFLRSEIEGVPGDRRWDIADWHVSRWQADRLAIVGTIWPFVDWDQRTCHGSDPQVQPVLRELPNRLFAPCDDDAFVAWLADVVERYDGDGVDDMPGLAYPIRHWEVANEPAMQGGHGHFFQGTSADYLSMLELAFDTITSADAMATVLTGGQAGMQVEFVDFWRPVLESAGDAFHLGNIHSIGSDRSFFSDDYRAFLDETGHADRSYWVTEALVPTMPEPGQRMPTGDDLARTTLTGFTTAFADGASRIFNVGPHDPTGGPGPESDAAYLLLARTVSDFTSATWTSDSSVRFDMPDGRTVHVLWNGAGLPAPVSGSVQTVGYDGTVGSVDAADFMADVPTLVTLSP